MKIRLGYELIYDCPQPTPMLLMLNVHYSRVSDLAVPDQLVTEPARPDPRLPGRLRQLVQPDRRPRRAHPSFADRSINDTG